MDPRRLDLPGSQRYGGGDDYGLPWRGDLIGWGSGGDERLVFWLKTIDAYVVVDASMEPVAQFARGAHMGALWPLGTNGRYVALHEHNHHGNPSDELSFFDLGAERSLTIAPSARQVLHGLRQHSGGGWFGGIATEVADGGMTVTIPRAESCRMFRYSVDGTLLSDRLLPCWNGGSSLTDISPDGRMAAIATSGIAHTSALDQFYGVTVISIFDAATGEELLRIKGAAQPWDSRGLSDLWLADSSGIVVRTSLGNRIVTLDGRWEPSFGFPAPNDAGLFADGTTVRDRQGRVLASLAFSPGSSGDGASDPWAGWGSTSRELRVNAASAYAPGWASMPSPVIERPPLDDRLLFEVTYAGCLNLRSDPSSSAAVVTCLPRRATAEAIDYHIERVDQDGDGWSSRAERRVTWMHLRTPDGLEGWASAEYLRWHSDGVRLEE